MLLAPSKRLAPFMLSVTLFGCGSDSAPSSAEDAGAASKDAAGDGATANDAQAVGDVCDPKAPTCAKDEKCVATRWNLNEPWPAPRCVPELGERGAKEREVCFSAAGVVDACGTGLSCTSFGTGEGFCLRTCSLGEVCGEGTVCAEVDETSGFRLCAPTCTVDADCNAPGWLACVERNGTRYCDAARTTM